MNLRLIRRPSTVSSTIGELVDDDLSTHLCWTLEDPVREIPGAPVESWKIPGRTAIPRGRYRVLMTPSPRFGGRILPILCGVPGYEGIRIHAGNTSDDTEGCILVGFYIAGDTILTSRPALQMVCDEIGRAIVKGEEVWIDVG